MDAGNDIAIADRDEDRKRRCPNGILHVFPNLEGSRLFALGSEGIVARVAAVPAEFL